MRCTAVGRGPKSESVIGIFELVAAFIGQNELRAGYFSLNLVVDMHMVFVSV